jgi:hypothetical protein
MIYTLQDCFPKELILETKNTVEPFLCESPYGGTYNRKGKTVDITKTVGSKELDEKINKFMIDLSNNFITHTFMPEYATSDSGYEYHKYEVGDQCLVHGDGIFSKPNAYNSSSLIRIATVIIHLNTIKNGGETVFPNQGKTIKTIEGQVLIFPPNMNYQHYVTASDETREILMTWFVYQGINAILV